MTGPHLEEAISAWLDDELAPAARREAALHLERCPDCRQELDLVARARAAVRALPVRTPPPGFLEDLVPPAIRSLYPRRRGAAWAMAAAAASVAALFLPREASVTPVLPALVESHATRASLTADPLSQLAPIAVPVSFGP
ncbi:MAG: anti-sigma factor family protein [Acidimicrobiia bacterium]